MNRMKRILEAFRTTTISAFLQPCMWGLCLFRPDGQDGFGFRLGPLVLGVFWERAE